MTVYMLSRRHALGYVGCDVCKSSGSSRRFVLPLVVLADTEQRMMTIKICRACLLEGADCAAGRTARGKRRRIR